MLRSLRQNYMYDAILMLFVGLDQKFNNQLNFTHP